MSRSGGGRVRWALPRRSRLNIVCTSDLWPPHLLTWRFLTAAVYFKSFKGEVSSLCSSWFLLSASFSSTEQTPQADMLSFCRSNGNVFSSWQSMRSWTNAGAARVKSVFGRIFFPHQPRLRVGSEHRAHCWSPTPSLCHSKGYEVRDADSYTGKHITISAGRCCLRAAPQPFCVIPYFGC